MNNTFITTLANHPLKHLNYLWQNSQFFYKILFNYTYFRHYFIMKKVTVIELSEQTGLTRSQIYYLNRTHKLINLEGKINLEDALRIITTLNIKKIKPTDDKKFRHILNILHLQNIALQKQLDLAHEREKNYLAELASYRQNLAPKTTLHPPTFEGDKQALLENNGVDTDENSQKSMQSESEYQICLDSHQSINKQTKSVSEVESNPISTESIYNEMTLPESKNWDTRPKNESTEKSDGAVNGTLFPTCDDTKLLLNKNRQEKPTAQLAKTNSAKLIYPNPIQTKQKVGLPTDQLITDQDNLYKKDPHDYEY